MSTAEFQKRIADLKFSAEEYLKALQKEQDDSESDHEAYDDAMNELEEGADEPAEPETIDHSEKIAHIETAIGHLDAAVDELDGAIDED